MVADRDHNLDWTYASAVHWLLSSGWENANLADRIVDENQQYDQSFVAARLRAKCEFHSPNLPDSPSYSFPSVRVKLSYRHLGFALPIVERVARVADTTRRIGFRDAWLRFISMLDHILSYTKQSQSERNTSLTFAFSFETGGSEEHSCSTTVRFSHFASSVCFCLPFRNESRNRTPPFIYLFPFRSVPLKT